MVLLFFFIQEKITNRVKFFLKNCIYKLFMIDLYYGDKNELNQKR